MKKFLAFGIIILFVGMTIPLTGTIVENLSSVSFNGKTLYVGGSGPGNYTTIQSAIDDASDGDTVFVYDNSSPYYENVVVDKTINLIGEDRNTTVIDGNESGDVVNISTDWVNISRFTIMNSGNWSDTGIKVINSNYNTLLDNNIISNNDDGVYLYNSSGNTVTGNNIFSNNVCGIRVYFSSGNTITGNTISDNLAGINLIYSNYNIVTGNTISTNNLDGMWSEFSNANTIVGNNIMDNKNGIELHYCSNNSITSNTITSNNNHGIFHHHSDNNTITGNNVSNNGDGIFLSGSRSNTITDNYIISNWDYGIGLRQYCNNTIISNNNYGEYLYNSGSNIIYNNYFNNTNNAWDDGNNIWNITKTVGTNIIGGKWLGGNYWNDYNGYDLDGDGLGDTPYDIPKGDNKDWHPLIEPYGETELEIGFISGGLFRIKAEIKNIGRYNATGINWTIEVFGRFRPIYIRSGEIPVIKPGKSETITTGFLLGLGKYEITVTAEASNAPKVSKTINGFIILFFINKP